MKAAVLEKYKEFRVKDIPAPQVKEHEVLVEVRFASICGTDQHIFAGDFHPRTQTPLIPGHEFAGVVEEMGSRMTEDFSHSGSVKSLLGEKPSEIQKLRFSNERQVTSDTPPTILIHSSDDHGVHPANSIAFYEALNAFGVTAELHIFNSGAHGYGLGRKDGTSHNHWPNTVEAFIRDVKN